MKIPLKSKVVSIVLKIIVVAAAALGVILSAQATKHTFMGGGRVFMFFTIQSNIAIAVISAIGAVFLLALLLAAGYVYLLIVDGLKKRGKD